MFGSKQSGLPTLPEGETIEQRVLRVFADQWEPAADNKTGSAQSGQ